MESANPNPASHASSALHRAQEESPLADDEVKLNAKLRVQSLVQKHGLQTGMPRLRRAYAFETLV